LLLAYLCVNLFHQSTLMPRHHVASLRTLAAGFLLLATTIAVRANAPEITNAPVAQTIFLGDPVTFRVGASATAPLSYQRSRNGTAVTGATLSVFTFTTAATDHNV